MEGKLHFFSYFLLEEGLFFLSGSFPSLGKEEEDGERGEKKSDLTPPTKSNHNLKCCIFLVLTRTIHTCLILTYDNCYCVVFFSNKAGFHPFFFFVSPTFFPSASPSSSSFLPPPSSSKSNFECIFTPPRRRGGKKGEESPASIYRNPTSETIFFFLLSGHNCPLEGRVVYVPAKKDRYLC